MPLKCKIGNLEFSLSDVWTNEDEFRELGPDRIREMIAEDILSFLEEIPDGLLSHCEFYWRDGKESEG